MIVDKISNWHLYFKAPIFEQIFKELKSYSIHTPNGTYKNNEHYYFKVMNYYTQLSSDVIESHIKEVDIQILLSGKECIKIYDTNSVEVRKDYDTQTDCKFYTRVGDPESVVNLKPGYMAVFFSDDIHHPVLAVNNKVEKLKKIVIKIHEKLFA